MKFGIELVYMCDAEGRTWKSFDCPKGYSQWAKTGFMLSMKQIMAERRPFIKVPVNIEFEVDKSEFDAPTPDSRIPDYFDPDFPRFVHFEMEGRR